MAKWFAIGFSAIVAGTYYGFLPWFAGFPVPLVAAIVITALIVFFLMAG